jgi:hypothetical protein
MEVETAKHSTEAGINHWGVRASASERAIKRYRSLSTYSSGETAVYTETSAASPASAAMSDRWARGWYVKVDWG